MTSLGQDYCDRLPLVSKPRAEESSMLLLLTHVNEDTRRYGLIGRSPRRRRTLRRRGLRKLALNSGTSRRSAKNAEKPLSPSPPPKPALL